MIAHLLKLAWNRKWKNALISLEVLIAFLVLVVVSTVGLAAWVYAGRPLGYDYKDVVVLDMRDEVEGDDREGPEQRQRAAAILEGVRGLEGVVGAAGCQGAPMSFAGSRSVMAGKDGRDLRFEFDEVTDGFLDTMDLQIVAGRWFGPEDDAAPDRRVVINRHLAEDVFGKADPIGQDLLQGASTDDPAAVLRVVGLVEDYRKAGEVGPPGSFLFYRKRLDNPKDRPPSVLLIEVDPLLRAGLERRIEEVARRAAPGWSFTIQSLSTARRDMLRAAIAPLVALALVGGYLLLMVAMGLAGVFWQSIAQRRSEIGLRRAAGATPAGVMRQVVGEVLALVTLAVAVGLAVALQVPILGLSAPLGPGVFPVAAAVSVVLIYLLAALSALAPAVLAAGVEPAEALRAE